MQYDHNMQMWAYTFRYMGHTPTYVFFSIDLGHMDWDRGLEALY